MNIMLLNDGVLLQSVLFAEALKKYFDNVWIRGNATKVNYKYFEDESIYNNYDICSLATKEELLSSDVILGLNHGVLFKLNEIKKFFPKALVGCQILDYPMHVFRETKDYNRNVTQFWKVAVNVLKNLDFLFLNQKISEKTLLPYFGSKNKFFVRHPVDRIRIEKYDRKDFIIYSGRIKPDKGVHYIINALSIIPEKIKLIVIGSGADLKKYASFLNVDYEQYDNISEKEKWKLYHQCRFLISGADNPHIPSLCILEGISIGRTGIVWNYRENYLHYNKFAYYCNRRSIQQMARGIRNLYKRPLFADNIAIRGDEFVTENCTYEVWGKRVNELILKIKEEKELLNE